MFTHLETILKPYVATPAKRWIAAYIVVFAFHMLFPQVTHAAHRVDVRRNIDPSSQLVISLLRAKGEMLIAPEEPSYIFASAVTDASPASVRRTMWVLVTAYSSTPDQTDSTPYITAANTFVRDGVIAANFLRFGTHVRMPEYFGDKEFFVEDRMNKRYWERIDIWLPTRAEAKQWGARWVKIEIL